MPTDDEDEVCGLHGVACPDGPLFRCQAKGIEDGKPWRCSETPGAKGYCDRHRMQIRIGCPITPLPERRDGSGWSMTIHVSDSDRELLGDSHDASVRAGMIVRDWCENVRRWGARRSPPR